MRRLDHRAARLAVLVSALAVSAGCGLMAMDFGGHTDNRCSGADDCASNSTCNESLGICVARNRPDVGVFLRFAYPSATGVTVREFQSQPLGTAGDLHIVLPQPVTVDGWVRGGDPLTALEASIVLLRPSPIPGGSSEQAGTNADRDPSFDDWVTGRTFSLAVPQSQTGREPYTAVIEPLGDDAAAFPPLTVVGLTFDGSGVHRLEVTLPSGAEVRRIAGLVVRSDGSPIPNLSVRAEDPETGRRISTIDLSAPIVTLAGGDPEDPAPTGSFELLLPVTVERFRLVVSPTVDEPIFPTLTIDGLECAALDADGDTAVEFDGIEQPAIAYPAIGLPVRLEGTVEALEVGSSLPSPVGGATLRFVRELATGRPDVAAVFEQVAVTDDTGKIVASGDGLDDTLGVPLLEGDYEVTVTPPDRLRLAGLYESFLRVAPASPTGERVQRGQVFQLGPRAELRGVVTDPLARPAASLLVETQLVAPSGDIQGADPTDLNRVVSGETWFDGAFDLHVEPGAHLLVLRPDAVTYFPWRLLPDVVAPDGPVDVELEAPVVLTGIVEIPGSSGVGEPAVGVTVDALVPTTAAGGSVVHVGRATSDADGRFHLLLSPSLDVL
ncbi:MAG: hypothetical protein JXB32_14200 [Deltaproteobacteria bacterium]|nr:hypothetical protein [Deltaproteobacteria bacterium]